MMREIRHLRRVSLLLLVILSRPDVLVLMVLVVMLPAAVDTGRSVNYCGAKMCGHTDLHTFCQFPEGPGPYCVGYMDAPLSVSEKTRVLNRLNQRRAAAASGRLRGFPAASNMLKLRWVEELSREAQQWADQCATPTSPEKHDACRDLFSVSVGQLVASVVGEAPGLRVESLVDVWYMQSMMYRANVSSYQPPASSSYSYGDFAQMLWAHSYLVGCGRSRFMVMPAHGRMRSVERLVCNMAPRGPPAGRPIWADGGPAAACPPRARPDPTAPGLCAYQETFDDSTDGDPAITIEENILLDTILTIERDATLDKIGAIDDLYLTRFAIANLQAETSTDNYNSMQKRDILNIPITFTNQYNMVELVDINEIKDVTNNSNQIMTTDSLITIAEDKSKDIRKETKVTIRVSTVGRPKSYNVEDLNGDSEDEIHANQHLNDIPIHELSDKRKEFYADYEYTDNIEDKLTDASLTTNTIDVKTSFESEKGLAEITTMVTETKELQGNESFSQNVALKIINETAKVEIDVQFSGLLGTKNTNFSSLLRYLNETSANETVDEKAIEDYLSDPETVRQLQEELDRMEREISLSSTTAGPAGKSRRELRNFPTESASESTSFTDVLIHTTELSIPSETDRKIQEILSNDTEPEEPMNTSLQNAPMLNMVMRYMPYLRDYEKTIMRRTQNNAFKPTLSNYLTLVFLPMMFLC